MQPKTHPATHTALFVALAVLLLLTALPAAAELAVDVLTTGSPGRVVAAQATPSCSGGLVYDDGETDQGLRLIDANNGNGVDGDLVMLFEAGAGDALIEQVCVCWNRQGNPPPTFLHEIIFYDDDDGVPGDEIAVVPATIENLPPLLTSSFFTYDLSGDDVRTQSENVFIGVRFFGGNDDEAGYTLCLDTDTGPEGPQPVYAALAGTEDWVPLPLLVPASSPTADANLMVRADVAGDEVVETCPATPCVEDDTTMCLNDDRFRVTGAWTKPPGQNPPLTGPAMVPDEELTTDTNYFWFFRDTNVEMVVKVLNGCPVNQHYWVFAGGLTNVAVEMQVCDTETGIQQTYRNPQGTPFQPIQDTAAFATCP